MASSTLPFVGTTPNLAKWILVTGERRFRAITELANEKHTFNHSDLIIPIGSIPITPLGEYLSSVGRFEAELDENVQRVDLDWPDRMQAYADLHSLRQTTTPHKPLNRPPSNYLPKPLTASQPTPQTPDRPRARSESYPKPSLFLSIWATQK